MPSRIVHRRQKNLYRAVVRMVRMRPYNVWAVQAAGVQTAKESQYQTQPPHKVDRFVRKSAKSIFVDRHRVEGILFFPFYWCYELSLLLVSYRLSYIEISLLWSHWNRSRVRNRNCRQSDQRTFNSNLLGVFHNEYKRAHPNEKTIADRTVLDWKFNQLDANKDEKIHKIELKEMRRIIRQVNTINELLFREKDDERLSTKSSCKHTI